MKNKKNPIIVTVALLIISWVIVILIDYVSVFKYYDTPAFSIAKETCDCGGSGTYKGLGYSFEIDGNFMYESFPEDSNSNVLEGVTHAKFKLFGVMISELNREESE